MTTTIMILLLILGVLLTFFVLLQHGKSHGLGTIAGAAENFLGKEKGTRVDRLLARLTTIFGILFVIAVLIIYIMQPTYEYSDKHQSLWGQFDISPYYGANEQNWINPNADTDEETSENGTGSSSDETSEEESQQATDSASA